METRTWGFHFVTSKCLDYMQYDMKLLEQYGYTTAKVDVTVTRLDEDQNHVCLVT